MVPSKKRRPAAAPRRDLPAGPPANRKPERERVADQAAELQADPEGKKLVEQLTGWANEIVARLERTLAAWPELPRRSGWPDHASSRPSWTCGAGGHVSRWPAGQTIVDVISRLAAIESGLGTFRGAVRIYPTPDDKANRFELRVLTSDPHADAIAWPGPSVTSITEPIDLGPFEDATPAKVLLLRRRSLFGGPPGRVRAAASTS